MYYLEAIRALENTSGKNAKLKILKTMSSPLLERILYATYHPLTHYHMRALPYEGQGVETLASTEGAWPMMLYDLSVGALSGKRAKSVIGRFINDLTQKEGEIFKRIIKKDMRCGISVTTINAAYPDFIPVFGAMLAKKYTDGINGPRYISLKLDGLRGILQTEALYTRNGHKIKGMRHIIEALRLAEVDSVDGELMIPGLDFQTASGLIRSDKPCPEAVLHIFDIPNHPGSFVDRLKAMKEIDEKFQYMRNSPVEVVKHVLVKSHEKIISTYEKAIYAGYEGLMVKTPNHHYQMKRSSDWQKVKATLDKDLKVIGFFEGQGKYEGSLGGIIVNHDGVEVKVGGGFSDVERDEIWGNQRDYFGLTAEILYHEETPDGSLRHPRIKSFRVDK